MAAKNTASERPVAVAGETLLCSVSLAGILDSGELLASVTSVTEQTSTDLTISNTSVNSAALTINNQTVIIGNAIQFKMIGQLLATGSYTLKIIVVTDSTPAQTRIGFVKFDVADE